MLFRRGQQNSSCFQLIRVNYVSLNEVEHGMTEYELKPDGTRVSTRFAPGNFAMMRDFIRDGRIGDHYGKAEITQPRVH